MEITQEQNDLLQKFDSLQDQIWQTVSLAVSEANKKTVQFKGASCATALAPELQAEFTGHRLVTQYAFSNLPENTQILLLDPETCLSLSGVVSDAEIPAKDKDLIVSARSVVASLVQGLCQAAESFGNEPVTPIQLAIEYEDFVLPPQMQNAPSLLKVVVTLESEGVQGPVTWILDEDTARSFLGSPEPQVAFLNGTPENTDAHRKNKGPSSPDSQGLNVILDIPLEVSVELGRVKMLVKEVLELGPGSVVGIDKAAGEPVDVLVNGKLTARGEVVVIEDNFGVQITEILSNPMAG